MSRTVAVLQSNYLPWIGYFDLIRAVDLFIFYDDVQYTKNSWRNRNLIKSPHGLEWLTIPVGQSIHRLISEVALDNGSWQESHFRKVSLNYKSRMHLKICKNLLNFLYVDTKWSGLSEFNQASITWISREIFEIRTEFDTSVNYELTGKGQERLLQLLRAVGATNYISGPSGKNYLRERDFLDHKIELRYFEYPSYPKYEQVFPPFRAGASVIDLILCLGDESKEYFRNCRAL
jgi:hypothetical protein